MWTKRELVVQAFEEIGMSNYVFNIRPEQMQSALRRLDTMMAVWNSRGIRIGYALSSTPTSGDLDQLSGVPDEANEAIFLNLAARIAPSYGKVIQRETAVAAKMAYDALQSRAESEDVPEVHLPSTMPRGSGNKPWRNLENPFMTPPEDPLESGPDGDIEFN